jgi:lipopolysaccharide/colanic/teichoic acid biosynthesis glycosyltransferase
MLAADQMRRSGDFLITCILLALTLPLMGIVALAIKCESTGPVFERRARVGNGGRPFQMLSFRTSVQRPGQLRSSWQTTQVGQFLQNTRIDTLPQLFNVLRGEMNFTDTALFD